MPSNHLILCRPLLLPPSIFLSIGVFSNESVLRIRWLKYWSFSFSISSSNEYSGLISFRIDWLNLRAVQETLKSLLQHHKSKASILWLSSTEDQMWICYAMTFCLLFLCVFVFLSRKHTFWLHFSACPSAELLLSLEVSKNIF